jgi:hypothetical protein
VVGKKNVLIIADLGAAANCVKNLLLMGEYAWPLKEDKFKTLLNQYRNDLRLSDWLSQEYKLRHWKKFFGIDLSDDLNFDSYCQKLIEQNLPIIFINHTSFHQREEFYKFSDCMDILFVAPTSEFGYEWQVRAYCEKKTVKNLHDFTFAENKEKSVIEFKNRYGDDAYYEINITNMKEITKQRQQEFRSYIDDRNFLPLETLLFGNIKDIVDFLNNRFQQNLPFEHVQSLINAWKKLHWPIDQTANWRYHHLFL